MAGYFCMLLYHPSKQHKNKTQNEFYINCFMDDE